MTNTHRIKLPVDPSYVGHDGVLVRTSEDTGPSLMVVEAASGQKVGVQFEEDGTLTLGAWDVDGEWVEIVPSQACADPGCKGWHVLPLPLDQLQEALLNADA